MNILLYKVALLLYLVATLLALVSAVRNRPERSSWSMTALLLAFTVHSLTLLVRYLEAGYTPVTNLHESLSFFAWTLAGVFTLVNWRLRMDVLAVTTCTFILVLMLFGSLIPMQTQPLNPALDSFWLPIHVGLAFLGNAVFTVAFVAGVFYLVQERMLKSKKFSALYYRLPSLETLDSLNYRCLTFGFPLMTMGIISGAVWAESAWGTYWSWDPKEAWALITWFLYAALLHGRLTVGWRGRRAAIFAIIGFLFVLFTFLGVNLLLPGLHSYSSMAG
ncbi:c-type cytochrome biogenesis protein CcsB [Desulfuromonas thiophila]|uniref:Cytochrome c-type biogenesis protein CcsB n=1 Tax=Desulfuromonas thiophila TaxID=57664 RepID=A0A1G6XDX6_9BACT|nr:c-type cytochrome biogenesis protein CcsB [Desulfuromonas thiophila]SDD76444.1 cytochrome c-type biogenesis protein CcsB [Desulfuromonas thiophila]